MNNGNNKGYTVIALLVLLFVFISGLFIYIYVYKMNKGLDIENPANKTKIETVSMDEKKDATNADTSNDLDKESATISIDDIDVMFEDIDKDSTEDLSDMDL